MNGSGKNRVVFFYYFPQGHLHPSLAGGGRLTCQDIRLGERSGTPENINFARQRAVQTPLGGERRLTTEGVLMADWDIRAPGNRASLRLKLDASSRGCAVGWAAWGAAATAAQAHLNTSISS